MAYQIAQGVQVSLDNVQTEAAPVYVGPTVLVTEPEAKAAFTALKIVYVKTYDELVYVTINVLSLRTAISTP